VDDPSPDGKWLAQKGAGAALAVLAMSDALREIASSQRGSIKNCHVTVELQLCFQAFKFSFFFKMNTNPWFFIFFERTRRFLLIVCADLRYVYGTNIS